MILTSRFVPFRSTMPSTRIRNRREWYDCRICISPTTTTTTSTTTIATPTCTRFSFWYTTHHQSCIIRHTCCVLCGVRFISHWCNCMACVMHITNLLMGDSWPFCLLTWCIAHFISDHALYVKHRISRVVDFMRYATHRGLQMLCRAWFAEQGVVHITVRCHPVEHNEMPHDMAQQVRTYQSCDRWRYPEDCLNMITGEGTGRKN